MDLSGVLGKFTRIFNILGESTITFNPTEPQTSPISYLVSFLIYFPVLPAHIFLEFKKIITHTKVDIPIQVVFVGSFVLARCADLMQMYSLTETFTKFLIQFKQFEQITRSKFKMDLSEFRSIFLAQVIPVIVFWLCTAIVTVYTFRPDAVDMGAKVIFLAITFLSRVGICHILFYLTLIKMCFDLTQNYMETIQIKTKGDKCEIIRSELLCLKLIHLKLFEITKTFNVLFGWVLLLTFQQQFLDIVFRMYWTFRYLYGGATAYTAMRKFVFFLSIFLLLFPSRQIGHGSLMILIN